MLLAYIIFFICLIENMHSHKSNNSVKNKKKGLNNSSAKLMNPGLLL